MNAKHSPAIGCSSCAEQCSPPGFTTRATGHCYVCNGRCASSVRQGRYEYEVCEDCLTAQITPVPSDEELQDFYERYHGSAEEGGSYIAFESRMQADFPWKLKMVRQVTSAPAAGRRIRLLDVGCGKGYFLKEAASAGFEAVGIDLSTSAVAFARESLGVNAESGHLEAKANAQWCEAFDVVTLWASIEHLPHPLTVLKAIRRCLRPGGLLFCDTGLGGLPEENGLAGYNQWFDAPEHLFVFSGPGLRTLLERAGFEVIHVDYNAERSRIRRIIRYLRHVAVCRFSLWILRPLLGRAAFLSMKRSAKWPIGRLTLMIARRRDDS
ncbi:MAG: putative 3-demethylubiquinone-9 3-O-methyltransferase [Nitrospira sp.]|nr:putative 3-demethylubiquinone-9 3-O-methyltransferase [Nitrospira sp.]